MKTIDEKDLLIESRAACLTPSSHCRFFFMIRSERGGRWTLLAFISILLDKFVSLSSLNLRVSSWIFFENSSSEKLALETLRNDCVLVGLDSSRDLERWSGVRKRDERFSL